MSSYTKFYDILHGGFVDFGWKISSSIETVLDAKENENWCVCEDFALCHAMERYIIAPPPTKRKARKRPPQKTRLIDWHIEDFSSIFWTNFCREEKVIRAFLDEFLTNYYSEEKVILSFSLVKYLLLPRSIS